MRELKITRTAFETIRAECLKRTTETGGLLIGTLEDPAIIKVTVPGPRAELSAGHFKADAKQDQWELDLEMRRYQGKAKNIGYWHLHLGSLSRPSGGDLAQAKEIVDDLPGDGEKPRVYVLIANVADGAGRKQVKLYAYTLSKGESRFSPVQLALAEDDSEQVKKALEKEPALIVARETDFWRDLDFNFYRTTTGRSRLEREAQELNDLGYAVKVKRGKGSQKLILDIPKDGHILRFLLPIEYPLNPPSLLWLPEGWKIKGLESIAGWNTDCRLAAVVREVEERAIGPQGPVNAQVVLSGRQGEEDEGSFVRRAFPTFIALGQALGKGACLNLWGGKGERRAGQHFPNRG